MIQLTDGEIFDKLIYDLRRRLLRTMRTIEYKNIPSRGGQVLIRF